MFTYIDQQFCVVSGWLMELSAQRDGWHGSAAADPERHVHCRTLSIKVCSAINSLVTDQPLQHWHTAILFRGSCAESRPILAFVGAILQGGGNKLSAPPVVLQALQQSMH